LRQSFDSLELVWSLGASETGMRWGDDPDLTSGQHTGEAGHRYRAGPAVQQQERTSFSALLYDQLDLDRPCIWNLVRGQGNADSSRSFHVAFFDFFSHLLDHPIPAEDCDTI
jgi:hypothetical protein